MNLFRSPVLSFVFFFYVICLNAQFTAADTLRGSITPEREWWDLTHYNLDVEVFPEDSSITGKNTITYSVLKQHDVMQIDLQEPLKIDYVAQDGQELTFSTKGNAHFIQLESEQILGSSRKITIHYSGRPHIALRAPWDGGISWKYDENGKPFIASSCQGIGASIWWPCKDHMYDEPDSMLISVTTPDDLMNVSNGKLIGSESLEGDRMKWNWKVVNPISNYVVNLSVGDYVHFGETYDGLNGPLTLDYYVLRNNLQKAQKTIFRSASDDGSI